LDTLWKGRAACNVRAILAACARKVKFFSIIDLVQKSPQCRARGVDSAADESRAPKFSLLGRREG
jgi:hypothetical protein